MNVAETHTTHAVLIDIITHFYNVEHTGHGEKQGYDLCIGHALCPCEEKSPNKSIIDAQQQHRRSLIRCRGGTVVGHRLGHCF